MDSSVNAFIVAQYAKDRIAEATSARRAHEAKGERAPKLRHARRRLTPRTVTPTPETSRTVTVPPPV